MLASKSVPSDGSQSQGPQAGARALHQVRPRPAGADTAGDVRAARGLRLSRSGAGPARAVPDGVPPRPPDQAPVPRGDRPRRAAPQVELPDGGPDRLRQDVPGRDPVRQDPEAADRGRRHHDVLGDRLRRPGPVDDPDPAPARGRREPDARVDRHRLPRRVRQDRLGPEQRDLRRRRHDQGRHRHGRPARAARRCSRRARSSCRSS